MFKEFFKWASIKLKKVNDLLALLTDEFEIGKLSTFLFVMLAIVFLWLLISVYEIIPNYYSSLNVGDKLDPGRLGDSYGAVTSLFSALAFAGLVYTILLQRKELKETRAEFSEQNLTLKTQKFETTFFHLLENHNNMVENMVVADDSIIRGRQLGQIKGRLYIKMFYDHIKAILASNKPLSNHAKEYFNLLAKFRDTELYFASMRVILMYIHSTLLIHQEDKKMYIDILRSKLGYFEIRILFYHVAFILNHGDTVQLRKLVLYYDLINLSDFKFFRSEHIELVNKLKEESKYLKYSDI
ncbi:putative phage abortive infection protein [Ohtaekwangia kribbensis]|uniref:Phage abortive infection protein n=1 Tax=Ohtaekwangia kribbensis TaxID=688913 RepID=A0ABW3K1X3_9BACT